MPVLYPLAANSHPWNSHACLKKQAEYQPYQEIRPYDLKAALSFLAAKGTTGVAVR